MDDNKDKIFKPSASAGSGFSKEIERDLRENLQKFHDPIVLAEMVYKLLEERENTNRILKNIMARLEKLEQERTRVQAPEIATAMEELLIPEVDEKILEFVRKHGKATAEDVRAQLNYKGKNAASARLNRLCNLGVLRKRQVGKKMFFFP